MEKSALLGVLGVVALCGFVYTATQVPWPNLGASNGVQRTPVDFKHVDAKIKLQAPGEKTKAPAHAADKVTVDLHVMSICPDAVFCENTFSDVLEQVGEIVELTTQYIATITGSSFTCKHGDRECEGNRVQLCARAEYPDPAQWFNFILCQDERYQLIPANTESCANNLHLNATTITSCASSERGSELLRTSIALTDSRSITKSCSVVINNQLVCIRDGGQWYSCPNGTDFVGQICNAYTGDDLPAACTKSAASVKIAN